MLATGFSPFPTMFSKIFFFQGRLKSELCGKVLSEKLLQSEKKKVLHINKNLLLEGLKTILEYKKMLVTSNFFFFQSCFY